jgi:hypothetical protein
MNMGEEEKGLRRGTGDSGQRTTAATSVRGQGDKERATGRRGTDDGNPGTLVGTESRDGALYARYRAKQGTWVSSSLVQQGYDKEYGKDSGYGAYAGIPRDPSGEVLENPDRIKPGQEYLIPVRTAQKPTLPTNRSESLPPSGLRPRPAEPERLSQPVRPRAYSGPSLPPWVAPDQAEAIKELARRREVRGLQSNKSQPTGALRGDTMESSWNEYRYHRDVIVGNVADHPLSTTPLDRLVMSALQADPNRFFPFNAVPLHGEHGIELGGEYNLVDSSWAILNPLVYALFLPPGGPYPVRVTEVGPRSFTFTSLPGHFDEPGSTIRFSTYLDNAGNVHFVHDGNARESPDWRVTNVAAPALAPDTVWRLQESNLRSWLDDVR